MTAVAPEISVRAMQAEEFWQLRAGQEERDTALEAGHDTFGNEVYDGARLRQPRHESDRRDEQGRAGRKRTETRGVAARNLTQRSADEERDGGRDGDRGLAR